MMMNVGTPVTGSPKTKANCLLQLHKPRKKQLIKVQGQAGISATIIQDSVSHGGKRIITYELEYHRFIHAEFMTHRMFSRNAASSRAIPVERVHQNILDNPARPIVWQKNRPGMQSKEELTGEFLLDAKVAWENAISGAIHNSKELLSAGLHKQWVNRGTEPYQMMKTVMTTTEDSNWYELRDHEDAQHEIHELARVMKLARAESVPMPIRHGEWHVPYVTRQRKMSGMVYTDAAGHSIYVEDAKMISASCCAQVSYRRSDDSLEKAKMIFDRLIESKPQHASPIEHQATPMQYFAAVFDFDPKAWEPGITHVNRQGFFGSGNFYGWIQHRQLIG
jgi:thymidylate synthase ThyX